MGATPGFDRTHLLALLAEELGARDLFVFRRISGDRFAHLGGVGRGEGWAGIVELGIDDPTIVRRAVEAREPAQVTGVRPVNVFGPYYARSAVAVPLPPDTVAVFGHPEHVLPARSDDELRSAAERAAALIDHVSPAKRLADELEVLHAVKAMSACTADDLDGALQHVVDEAAAALSCELGVVYLREPERVALASRGWPAPGDEEDVLEAMRALRVQEVACPLCVQDAMQESLPSPFGPGAGIRSYYLLELSGAADGLLLLMHTDAMARGFTMLCRELGLRLVEVADDVIGAALHRERLRLEIEALNATARRDPLTGLFNRRAWDEALAAHDGNPASIVLLDLDDLKRVNDEKGHASGDDVLRTLAGVVRENVREDDLVARIGGDEIAVLMPDADESSCREVVARLETAIAGHPGVHGFPLSAAVGHGSCDTGTRLVDLLERADERMYEQKAGRAPRRLSA